MGLLHDIGHAYHVGIVQSGKQPEFFLLVAFLCSFGFIRTSAHLIRAQVKWWPGNVSVGGTHVHHLVWGICAMLIVGWCGIAFEPGPPVREILAILFGIGAGLTIDEFALWLNLKDVYWSEKGRQSVDAAIVVAACGLLVLLGVRVFVDIGEEAASLAKAVLAGFGGLAVLMAAANALKGKLGVAAVSLFMPFVGLVGVFRLARPGSPWARLYGDDRRHRAEARFAQAAS